MQNEKKYWVVIPAAGSGKRFGADIPKQYFKIDDKIILDHTLSIFIDIPGIEKIVVVLAEGDTHWSESLYRHHNHVETTIGGKERFNSVLNGLNLLDGLADDNDWVLVHDAARPCLHMSDIKEMLRELQSHEVGGLLAVPVKDTMKRAGKNNEVAETVDRSDLWHALTPQMFRFSILKKSLESSLENNIHVTDESQAVEYQGLRPKIVEGRPENIKITSQADLKLAERFINTGKNKT